MMPSAAPVTPFLTWCLILAFLMLAAAFILVLVRLLSGPSLPDRIVALDLFGLLAVAAIGLFTLWIDQHVFLDAAIALAVVAFFGTVAYARFVEKRGNDSASRREGPAEGTSP